MIEQVAMSFDGKAVTGQTVRRLRVPSQPEGCVVDTRNGRLFVGEEKAGIWSFDARAGRPGGRPARRQGRSQAACSRRRGLALAPEGADGGYLIASSQGDNALRFTPAGHGAGRALPRHREGLGRSRKPTGLRWRSAISAPAFPGGLFVAQDGKNRPNAQNFKLCPGRRVVAR